MRRSDQDQVLIRAEVAQNVDHFDVELLGLRPPKDRQPVALHAGLNLVDVNEAGIRLRERSAEKRNAQNETQPGEQPLHA